MKEIRNAVGSEVLSGKMKIGWQVARQGMGKGQHTGAAVLLPVGCVIWPKGMDPPERVCVQFETEG